MSTGQWLFDEAAETGDWESAAIQLRSELAKALKYRDELIASILTDRADVLDRLGKA